MKNIATNLIKSFALLEVAQPRFVQIPENQLNVINLDVKAIVFIYNFGVIF